MAHQWIEHKGKRFLLADFSNFGQDVDAMAVEMGVMADIIAQEPDESLLGMVDIRGTVLSRELVNQVKSTLQEIGQSIAKSAVIVDQVTGFKKVIIDSIARLSGRNTKLFGNTEEAQDWLVSDD